MGKSEKAARLYRNGTLVAQAGEAEDQLAGVIGAQAQGGPAGLLWVRQGVVDMSEGGAEQVARRGIMDSVAGEVEAMTGGRRMEAALAAVRKALDAVFFRMTVCYLEQEFDGGEGLDDETAEKLRTVGTLLSKYG